MAESRDAILYLGGGVRGLHCLRALLAAGEPVAAVVGHAGSEGGEAARLAADAGLPVRAPASPNDAETLRWIRGLGCRLAVMSGYARIVKKAFLDCFADGVINLHGGPLPHYRGLSLSLSLHACERVSFARSLSDDNNERTRKTA